MVSSLFQWLRVCGVREQLAGAHQVGEEGHRVAGLLARRGDAARAAQRRAAGLVVEQELLERLREQVVEQPRSGDEVDSRERAEQGAVRALHPGLVVGRLGVREPEVAVGREAERAADLRVRDVEHGALDRAHRRAAVPHVEGRGRAAPDQGRPRAGELVDRHAGQVLGGELDEGAAQGHRRGRAGHRHGHEVRRHAGARRVDERRAGQSRSR